MSGIGFTYIVCLAVVVICATTCFGLSRYLDKRDDFADVAWGALFIAIAVCSYGMHQPEKFVMAPALVVLALVIVWGARLVVHVGARFARSRQEDGRYVAMRSRWTGNVARNSYTRVFLLQGLLALIISSPVIFVTTSLPDFSVWVYIGAGVWVLGFLCEAIADRQLRRFVKNPAHKGKLMTGGLWHYSRHPNYFGELVQWWGLGIIALSVPWGWVSWLGPLLLTVLIVKVSGVPLAEARAANKPGWNEYKIRTSVLVPLLPKKLEK